MLPRVPFVLGPGRTLVMVRPQPEREGKLANDSVGELSPRLTERPKGRQRHY